MAKAMVSGVEQVSKHPPQTITAWIVEAILVKQRPEPWSSKYIQIALTVLWP